MSNNEPGKMSMTTQFARTGRFETAYVKKGLGPTPLLLLHGGTGETDHHFFDQFLLHLGETFTAIAYDQRDCGATKLPDDDAYELTDLADDAVRLLDALGYDKVHVLGNSLGGVIAQLIALRHPERVDRLLLSVSFPANQNLLSLNPDGAAKRSNLLQARDYAGFAAFMSSPSYVKRHPELVDHLKAFITAPVEASRHRRTAAASNPPALESSSIPHRTLVIAGEEDQLSPPWISEQLAAAIPNATSLLFPGVGHMALMQRPAEAAEIVERFIVD